MATKRTLSNPPPVSGLPDCVFSLQPASVRLLSALVASPGYKYPELDTSKHWAKVPSQAVSDMLMEEFQKIEKEEKKASKKSRNKHISPNGSMTDIWALGKEAAAGAIIAGFGVTCAIAIDAVTFVGSALVICTMNTNEEKGGHAGGGAQSYLELLKGGCRYIAAERTILSFIILAVVANAMFVPFNSLQAPLVAEVLESGEAMLSVLSVALSVGMLLSTVVFPYLARRIPGKWIVFLCGLCFGLYYISLALIGRNVRTPQAKYALVALGSFLAGFLVSFLSTYISATFLQVVKQEYIARTAAIMNSAGACAIPVVSFLVSVASSFGTTGTIFAASGVLLMVLLVILALVLKFE